VTLETQFELGVFRVQFQERRELRNDRTDHFQNYLKEFMEQSPKIKTCVAGCKNEYQDKIYGKNRRVMNPVKQGGYRCTVCGKVQDK
jgi:hypothetical protein